MTCSVPSFLKSINRNTSWIGAQSCAPSCWWNACTAGIRCCKSAVRHSSSTSIGIENSWHWVQCLITRKTMLSMEHPAVNVAASQQWGFLGWGEARGKVELGRGAIGLEGGGHEGMEVVVDSGVESSASSQVRKSYMGILCSVPAQ